MFTKQINYLNWVQSCVIFPPASRQRAAKSPVCRAGDTSGGVGRSGGEPSPGGRGPPAHVGGCSVRQGHDKPGSHPEPNTEGPVGRVTERLCQTGEAKIVTILSSKIMCLFFKLFIAELLYKSKLYK